jgi:hypothetical protein
MSNNYFEIEAVVYSIGETQQVNESFKKRELITTFTEENNGTKYVKYFKFETIQGVTDSLDYVSEGDRVKVGFVLDGRKWNPPDDPSKDVFFNSLKALNVNVIRDVSHDPKESSGNVTENFASQVSSSSDEYDDLPF